MPSRNLMNRLLSRQRSGHAGLFYGTFTPEYWGPFLKNDNLDVLSLDRKFINRVKNERNTFYNQRIQKGIACIS